MGKADFLPGLNSNMPSSFPNCISFRCNHQSERLPYGFFSSVKPRM